MNTDMGLVLLQILNARIGKVFFCDLENAKAQHINLCENCANRRDDRKCFACYYENLSTFTKEGET